MVSVSSKVQNGSLWVPFDILRKLGCAEGEEIDFVIAGDRVYIQKKAFLEQRTFSLDEIIADTYASREAAP